MVSLSDWRSKMSNYFVTLVRQDKYAVVVEADNEEEALEMVNHFYTLEEMKRLSTKVITFTAKEITK